MRRRSVAIAALIALVAAPLMAAIPQSEHDALMAFYNSTGGPSWTDNTGWGGALGTEGTWKGIQLAAGGNSVSGLWLANNNLTGTIPAAIEDLPGLQYMEITWNSVTGSLPAEIATLSGMVGLWLGGNQLSGSIPPELGNLSNLKYLSIPYNQFSGSIPPELGNLSSLLELEINNNQMTGTLPFQLGNLASIQRIDMSSNQISGTIPSEMGSLSSLRSLQLYSNQLTGAIPPALGNLTNLESLLLSWNQLSGTIPPELGNNVLMSALVLGSNQLSGSIPPELGNLAALQHLDLSENQLSGTIPPQLGTLANLQVMNLQYNQLSGTIPPQIGSLSNLSDLSLRSNQLTGSLPPEMGNLTGLISLDLLGNHLSGSIPSTLGNLSNLWGFNLALNNFSGNIPAQLGNLASLNFLYLNWNNLTGMIPSELGNLSTLEILGLQGNVLTGPIPSSLTNLSNLTDGYGLDISYNGLYTTDGTLTTFLNTKSSGWDATQTIAPVDVSASALSPFSMDVAWTPILYTGNAGGYRVYFSVTSGGPYSLCGTTADKSTGSMTVNGLDPGTDYCFVVSAVTYPHPGNANTVASDTGAETCAATVSCPEIIVYPATLPSVCSGSSYNQILTASAGTAPFHFSVASGSLPPGLILSENGSITGAPSGGTFDFTIEAADALGCKGNRAYSLSIPSTPSQPVITGITDQNYFSFGLIISFTPGTPAERHDLYKDGILVAAGFQSGGIYTPLDNLQHSYSVMAVNGSCAASSNPVSMADQGTKLRPRPRLPLEPLPFPVN